jgi:signal peptide peptidase SppA
MYPNILAEARASIWLIRPDKLDDIFALLEARESGIRTDAAALAAFAADNTKRREIRVQEYESAGKSTKQQPRDIKGVGVIPILGTIVQRGNMFTEASGTASTDVLSKQFDALMANEQVGTILADIDSPGGTVVGVPELATKIQSLRGQGKPLVASVNAEAGSAAYWLASAFDEIVITPSGSAGSIGCYARHEDVSGLNEKLGVKTRYISYGRFKTEGAPDSPLTDEAAAAIQQRVDKYGLQFEQAVAANRGISLADVQNTFGQGRMLSADDAKRVNMVDKVESFEQTVKRLLTPRARVTRRAAHARRWLETLG